MHLIPVKLILRMSGFSLSDPLQKYSRDSYRRIGLASVALVSAVVVSFAFVVVVFLRLPWGCVRQGDLLFHQTDGGRSAR